MSVIEGSCDEGSLCRLRVQERKVKVGVNKLLNHLQIPDEATEIIKSVKTRRWSSFNPSCHSHISLHKEEAYMATTNLADEAEKQRSVNDSATSNTICVEEMPLRQDILANNNETSINALGVKESTSLGSKKEELSSVATNSSTQVTTGAEMGTTSNGHSNFIIPLTIKNENPEDCLNNHSRELSTNAKPISPSPVIPKTKEKRKIKIAAVFGGQTHSSIMKDSLPNSSMPELDYQGDQAQFDDETMHVLKYQTSSTAGKNKTKSLKQPSLSQGSRNQRVKKSWSGKKSNSAPVNTKIVSASENNKEICSNFSTKDKISQVEKQLLLLKESLQNMEDEEELVQLNDEKLRTCGRFINTSLHHLTTSFWQSKCEHHLRNLKIKNDNLEIGELIDHLKLQSLQSKERNLKILLELYS